MSLTRSFTAPFYEGGGLSTEVPAIWDVALNGRNYMLDTRDLYTGDSRFARTSIQLLKPQADQSGNVSEASLNPAEFARRAVESWHHGAGQTHLDRNASDAQSDASRFRSSKGVDVWTKWQLSLLPDTRNIRASSSGNISALTVGGYLYISDGVDLYWTLDDQATSVGWNPASIQAGEPGVTVGTITSDGYTIYAGLGANGIHTTVRGATTSTHYCSLAADLLGYVKGRLLAAVSNVLYEIADPASPSALLTQANVDFTWTCFADGPGQIYAAGFSGDKSLIYRVAVLPDGTDLDIPIVAGALPDGELIRTMVGYLGYLIVGTDLGVRVLQLDANGNVANMGRIIPTIQPVRCLEPQDHYVWYGLTDYDATSAGLGRIDLGVFPTDPLTPAYASDLMAAAQGIVTSVTTFNGRRIFTVANVGVFAQIPNRVPSGMIDSGLITYGMGDPKVAMNLDVRFAMLSGLLASELSADGGDFTLLGTTADTPGTSLVSSAGQTRADTFEVRLVLIRDGVTLTSGPTVSRWTLEANPAPGRGEYVNFPLRLFETVTLANASKADVDISAEIQALLSMETLGKPISLQTGEGTVTVFMDDHQILIDSYNNNRDGLNCVFIATLRRPRQRS